MRNIKLTLEYDGAEFSGFQAQPKKRTVQSELEKSFRKLFHKKINISAAAGRTDAGVHAESQTVNFKIDSDIPLENIHRALNTYLPEDLAISKIEEVDQKFHARFQTKSKTYEYYVWNSKVRSPLRRNRVYHFPYFLDFKLMQKAAKLLIGKHDFRSFQTQGADKNSVRTIYHLTLQKQGSEIRFSVTGDGFLYNMVRTMVGTLLFLGTGKITLPEFKKILKSKDRRHMGPTLPAHGLHLKTVQYSS